MKNMLYSKIKDIADLPMDKVIELKLEAAKIRKKHPGWSPKKVARTVAKICGVKVVSEKSNKQDTTRI